jgi:hypothetical protein
MSEFDVGALVEELRKLPHVATVTVGSEDPLRLEIARDGKRYPLTTVFPWSSRDLPAPSTVHVEVRDDYSFTQYSYLDLPGKPSSGDFILLTNPDATATETARELAAAAGVAIGNVQDLAKRIAQTPKLPSRWPGRVAIAAGAILLSPVVVVLSVLWLLAAAADLVASLWRPRSQGDE